MKTTIQLLCIAAVVVWHLTNAFGADNDRPSGPKKLDPNKPATLQTGITPLSTVTLDIGGDGTIQPHEVGVLAKDRDGNLWESRKMTADADSKIAFYPKQPVPASATSSLAPELSARYKWKPHRSIGLGAKKITVKGTRNSRTVEVPKGGKLPVIDGNLITTISPSEDGKSPSLLLPAKEGVTIIDGLGDTIIDDLNSTGVNIQIDEKSKETAYAGLTFTTPCALDILEDGTLLADKADILGKDKDGNVWASQKVTLNEKSVIAFFPRAASKPSGIDPEARYRIAVGKIVSGQDGGVVLRTSRGDALDIKGDFSDMFILMRPGDCIIDVKIKGAMISTLTLPEPCVLTVAKDKTLLADNENVTGKDSNGNVWTSRKVMLDGKEVFAFFQKGGAQATPTATKPQPVAGKQAAETKFDAKPTNWPKYSDELAGRMEVRVKNPNDFKVRVRLRSDGNGRDFTVAANNTESVRVPNGRYEIYFQYSTDPEGLYQGDSFTLNNNGVEIQIVKVVNGNYGIRKVK